MNLGLTGKGALVAASTSGLGWAIAQALAAEGARVVISGRRGDVAAELAAQLPEAVGVEVDLTQDGAAEQLVRNAQQAFGPISILVLNSGGPPPGGAANMRIADWRDAAQHLLFAQQEMVATVIKSMRQERWGRILSVGSSGVQEPIPNLALSNSVRAGLAGYLKTLSAEVAADGVTVNMLLPGRIATKRVAALDEAAAKKQGLSTAQVRAASQGNIPAGRYGSPEEFGAVAAFLCSDQASYITGSQIRVDGGKVKGY